VVALDNDLADALHGVAVRDNISESRALLN
jgi:hypothetical protein